MLSQYDSRVFELASRILGDWDLLATFYAAARANTCLKAGDHTLAMMWLDVIRAVEAMSESSAGRMH